MGRPCGCIGRKEMSYGWRFWELVGRDVGETGSGGVESQMIYVGGSIAE